MMYCISISGEYGSGDGIWGQISHCSKSSCGSLLLGPNSLALLQTRHVACLVFVDKKK